LEILNYPQKDLLKFLDFREAVGINTNTNKFSALLKNYSLKFAIDKTRSITLSQINQNKKIENI
jgi:hypothetical protein